MKQEHRTKLTPSELPTLIEVPSLVIRRVQRQDPKDDTTKTEKRKEKK